MRTLKSKCAFFVHLLAQGQTWGSMLQQCTNKNLTTDPFDNIYEVGEFSPEVDAGVVAGLKCLQPRWETNISSQYLIENLAVKIH
jgi:hypothetical protein